MKKGNFRMLLRGLRKQEETKQCDVHNVSKSVAKQYAEFCVRCDRKGLPLLELEDYIKEHFT